MIGKGCSRKVANAMNVMTHLAIVSILVPDQDEALRFYTEKLGMEKRADIKYGPGLRWLTVAAKGQHRPQIALARPDVALHGESRTQELMERIGQGEPWIFDTNDCRKTYEQLSARGVKFLTTPTKQIYGIEAVFEDPYGNMFMLLEQSPELKKETKERKVGSAA